MHTHAWDMRRYNHRLMHSCMCVHTHRYCPATGADTALTHFTFLHHTAWHHTSPAMTPPPHAEADKRIVRWQAPEGPGAEAEGEDEGTLRVWDGRLAEPPPPKETVVVGKAKKKNPAGFAKGAAVSMKEMPTFTNTAMVPTKQFKVSVEAEKALVPAGGCLHAALAHAHDSRGKASFAAQAQSPPMLMRSHMKAAHAYERVHACSVMLVNPSTGNNASSYAYGALEVKLRGAEEFTGLYCLP